MLVKLADKAIIWMVSESPGRNASEPIIFKQRLPRQAITMPKPWPGCKASSTTTAHQAMVTPAMYLFNCF